LPQNDPTEHPHTPVTELTPKNLPNRLNLVQVCFTHNLICKRALPGLATVAGINLYACFAADSLRFSNAIQFSGRNADWYFRPLTLYP
jgi:hypothetical protein